ncbi:hypothetical protein [Croceimicrobium hydrocarbonivorans]|uniref:Thioredoxin domain-containing protein n=1 Tax=Croceimicrobium hydrocarbonivorans TaxID=2761580 RepID=A0A7H0VAG7_9FLAO|nr:hypothetical protein [Croceimicrobium hydrocarbonivorans]QNR22715.1 hypothetical protein H4K34_10010 [Croceimicrobium hydrocarbonivorans]
MRLVVKLVFLMLTVAACGLIIIAPARKEKYFENHHRIQSGEETFYQEINLAEMENFLPRQSYVVTWAPWCPHSISLIRQMNQLLRANEKDDFILLSTSYDLEAIQRVTRNQANVKPFSKWIADGRSLGNQETDRMKNISLGLIDSVVTRSPAIYFRDSMGVYQLVTSTHFLRSLRASDEFPE